VADWLRAIDDYDFSGVQVALLPSVPGRHRDRSFHRYGQMRLRSLLEAFGPELA
jgi:hypothetical protein